MSVRWCWLGSHEIADGAPMVQPPGQGSHICVPCSETARGQFVMQMQKDRYVVPSQFSRFNASRMYGAMMQADYVKKRHGG